MKNLIKIVTCFLLVATFSSCSDDDSNGNNNNQDPSAEVTFNGNGININSLSLDEYPDYKSEAIFTTLNNVSIIIYFKKDTDAYQTPDDGEISYDADGGDYMSPDYPDNTVRGYINSGDGQYSITSGTIKVKLNEGGDHKFIFSNVKGENEEGEEGTLNGTVTVTED